MGAVGTGTRGGLRTAKRAIDAPMERLEDFGHQMAFYVRAFAWVWRVVVRYKKEVIRLLAEVSLGTGGLAVMGGSVAIVAFMTFFTGTEVGLQGYNALSTKFSTNRAMAAMTTVWLTASPTPLGPPEAVRPL